MGKSDTCAKPDELAPWEIDPTLLNDVLGAVVALGWVKESIGAIVDILLVEAPKLSDAMLADLPVLTKGVPPVLLGAVCMVGLAIETLKASSGEAHEWMAHRTQRR